MPDEKDEIWEAVWDAPSTPKPETPKLSYHTAEEISQMDLPPPEWIIPGILPEGLTILAARPKMGKSWLALNLAVCISHSLPVFGTIQAEPGDVLYLALEDTLRRVKYRYEQVTMAPDTRSGNGGRRCHIAITSARIDQGLPDQITHWISTVENPRLVIVDTLSKVRPQRRGEGDSYAESYVDIAALKEVADATGIGIMVIHHTRKQVAEDALEEVMGSTGFTGAADTILVMKKRRGEFNATLLVTGRDVEDMAVALAFDQDTGLWAQEGEASKFAGGSTDASVIEYLAVHEEAIGPKQLAEAIGVTDNAARLSLRRLVGAGRVEKLARGNYRLITTDVYDEEDKEV